MDEFHAMMSTGDGDKHEFPSVDASTDVSDESSKISRPPQALLDVNPQSYYPQILTIGPLHEMPSEISSADHCKAICVLRFMKTH